ncbi:MAG: RNB domain-containing ribonuclease, partial [Acidimicrobiales bacterium]
AGLDAIRAEFEVPGDFAPDVLAAAEQAATRTPGTEHADRTDVEYVTLDPATATDLDQAFAIEAAAGDEIILHYAIADVGFFVDPGDAIDTEAWNRGGTIYIPDAKAPLYPPVLSESAASLLPEGPRPAVVFTVRINPDGDSLLEGAERAVVRSRAKLAYEDVTSDDLPDGFAELARRIAVAEERRGAPRVDFPEQELVRTDDGDGWRLQFDARLESELHNAGMSLATNLAVADAMHAARTGLFRVMDDVSPEAVGRLRHAARAFGLEWPAAMSLAKFQRSLPRDDQRTAAFLLAVRRASGGARYEPYANSAEQGAKPWHAAMAAMYAHSTAPLRRLADRYVVETALAVANGEPVPEHVEQSFAELPKVMERHDMLGNRVDNAVVELAEAVLLTGREGDLFDGVIVDENQHGPVIQIAEPAVLARVRASRVNPGDEIRVELIAADAAERSIEFQRVS